MDQKSTLFETVGEDATAKIVQWGFRMCYYRNSGARLLHFDQVFDPKGLFFRVMHKVYKTLIVRDGTMFRWDDLEQNVEKDVLKIMSEEAGSFNVCKCLGPGLNHI